VPFRDPPRYAAWRHGDSRSGFEVAFLRTGGEGYRIAGETAAVEEGEAWAVDYVITLDPEWLTRATLVSSRASSGARELSLEADGAGQWRIDGEAAPDLDGCLDVDLESSALTNAFPVHRLGLEVGDSADAPAAYVRVLDLSVERLEQRYLRLNDDASRERYLYAAPAFGFESELSYDEFGLVLEYPGIAVRVA
jgi:uncharacterized protein